MPSKDKLKALERKRRYRRKLKIQRYGEALADVNMTGRHGNHRRGNENHRWAGERRITDQGYVAVRVPLDHPHSWGPQTLKRFRYAYEHHVVAMQKIGRPLLADEVVHHVNGIRSDNRPENLEIVTRSEHSSAHTSEPQARCLETGRFTKDRRTSGDLRVRQLPEVLR